MRIERSVAALGRTIRAVAEPLDEGWDISVSGGDRSHVGAITQAEPDGTLHTILRPGHRDDAVSERWARRLALAWHCPVCVRAGIHYDGIDRAGIEAVLAACDRLLEEILEGEENHACNG